MNNEQVIERLEKIKKRLLPSMVEDKEALKMAIEALKNERAKGEWIVKLYGNTLFRYSYFECDNCGKSTSEKTNYCPNCGADMRGN